MNTQRTLHEMGLSPIWALRDRPQVARNVPSEAASAAFSSAAPAASEAGCSTQVLPVSAQPSVQATAVGKEQIALLGWDELEATVAGCRACALCEQRRQAVLGVGDKSASWLFVGEGPGAEEDARGEPFVGPAGQLLDAMLAAIDLARGQDVYIANAVKCRPSSNRTPEAGEIAACKPYLERQIALIQPKIIVLLGRAAVHAVLGKDDTLTSLRGKVFEYRAGERNIPAIATYHPAYLLRTLPDKTKAWEDLCRARALMREAKQTAAGELAN